MILFKRFFSNRVFICYLTVAFSVLSFTSNAPAMFIPFPCEGNGANHGERDIQKIQKLLESKLVQHELSQLGLTKEEVEARPHQLDDEQIHQIANQIHALESGGDGEWVLIHIVLELTGVIDVFK